MGLKTILLSPIGGQAMPGIIDHFKGIGFKTVGIDSDPNNGNRLLVDEFIHVPKISEPSYRVEVLDTLKDSKINIFVSWLDEEIRFWNEAFYNRKIPKIALTKFAFNFRKDIMSFFDKWLLCEKLGKKFFPIPRTRILRGGGAWERLNFPTVFKPRIGTGSRDIIIVRNADEYDYYSRMLIDLHPENVDRFIAQEYIVGSEYTVDFFSNKGKLINSVIRLRGNPKGVSMSGEVVFDEVVVEIVKDLCDEFKIDGLNNVQLIETPDNHHFIIDLNPRPSGTIMLSVKAGVDFFNNLIERQAGKKPTQYTDVIPLKMFRHLREFYYE
jgi:carbamoyl-phosphate synthase large subunit